MTIKVPKYLQKPQHVNVTKNFDLRDLQDALTLSDKIKEILAGVDLSKCHCSFQPAMEYGYGGDTTYEGYFTLGLTRLETPEETKARIDRYIAEETAKRKIVAETRRVRDKERLENEKEVFKKLAKKFKMEIPSNF